MKNVNVFENFRTFETPDSYETEEVCGFCGKVSEQFIEIPPECDDPNGYHHCYESLICKSCLTRCIELLDKNFQEHMKKAKRHG